MVRLAAIGLAAAAPHAVAQSERRPFRIGLLPDLSVQGRQLFVDGLRRHGWFEGRDFLLFDAAIRTRMVPSASKQAAADIPSLTRVLVQAKPDLIVATSTAYAIAAHRISAIPVVMWSSGYPVEAGIADSLAHPGKNVTGATIYAGTQMWGKLLELLKEARPTITRVGVLWDYVPPAFPSEEIRPSHDELHKAAKQLGIGVHILEISGDEDVAQALAKLTALGSDALLVTSGWGLSQARHRVMQFAGERHIPVAVDFRWPHTIEPYPLLVYAASQGDLLQIAADYAVQILRGARAADLPIHQPRKFELVLNLRAARALGITIPQSLRLRADELIE